MKNEQTERQFVQDLFAWKEPVQLIARLHSAKAIDIDLQRDKMPTLGSFPFFERADFLFFVDSKEEAVKRLSTIRNFVNERRLRQDSEFCTVVEAMCEHFSAEGYVHFQRYARKLHEALESTLTIEISYDSDTFLQFVNDGWIFNNIERERITRYGSGAFSLYRIARTSHRGGSEFIFDDRSLENWALQVFCAIAAFKVFGKWMEMLRSKTPADVNYFFLRVADACDDSEMQERSFVLLKQSLAGISKKYEHNRFWQADLKTKRRDKSIRAGEEISDGEIPFAVAKALREDDDTAWSNSVHQLEASKPAPIAVRVRRDVVDRLYPKKINGVRCSLEAEYEDREIDWSQILSGELEPDPDGSRRNGHSRERLFDILGKKSQTELRRWQYRLSVESIGRKVCKSTFQSKVWELRVVEGLSITETIEELRQVTGKQCSAGRISQVTKQLLENAITLHKSHSN